MVQIARFLHVPCMNLSCQCHPLVEMDKLMTASTKRDEIPFGVFPQQATRAHMVHLEIRATSAFLTSPSITLENLAAEFSIGFGVETPLSRP